MDYSQPGFSVNGISQARVLEWIAISFSNGSLDTRIEPVSPALAGGFFTTEPPGKPHIYIHKHTYTQTHANTHTHTHTHTHTYIYMNPLHGSQAHHGKVVYIIQ